MIRETSAHQARWVREGKFEMKILKQKLIEIYFRLDGMPGEPGIEGPPGMPGQQGPAGDKGDNGRKKINFDVQVKKIIQNFFNLNQATLAHLD